MDEARRMDSALVDELTRIVGAGNVQTSPAALASYGYDAYFRRCSPLLVVAPRTTREVSDTIKALNRAGVSCVARGSGTGYAGGAVPNPAEAVVLLTNLNRIRELNIERRFIVAEAGVLTGTIQALVLRHGLRYPPDPSSRAVSTIGGNVATNAGGAHCLGYGVTSNYVLELECVDATGEIFTLGGETGLARGLDLRGVVVGSEGTAVIVTAVRLRLVPAPKAVNTIYATFETAAETFPAICDLFGKGILPIALDMTANVFHPRGLPLPFPNNAMLYIEIDGEPAPTAAETERVCQSLASFPCAYSVHTKEDLSKKRFAITQQRWRGITGELGLPAYFLFDAIVRRSDLGTIFEAIAEEARSSDFVVANTFHAGDGNIHPTPFFDSREPGIHDRLESFRDRVLGHVRSLGGALSGEHGLGLEKRHMVPTFYSAPAQRIQHAVMQSFQTPSTLGCGKLLPDTVIERPAAGPNWLRTPSVDTVNGFAVVSARKTLAELRAELSATPYQFAYEPVDRSPDTPLGELILAGVPAVRERRFGPPRDLLLGGVLLSPRGVETEFGSVFAKDVSGLDIRKLVFGSSGRIGRLETVALKLLPRDQTCLLGEISVADLSDGRRVLAELARVGGSQSSRFVRRDEQGAWNVGFTIDGYAADVASVRERLRTAFSKRALRIADWSFDGRDLFGSPLPAQLRWTEGTVGALDPGASFARLIAFDHPDLIGWSDAGAADPPRSPRVRAIELALTEAVHAL
jgi:FAD/FMN-containing dehydrogenase